MPVWSLSGSGTRLVLKSQWRWQHGPVALCFPPIHVKGRTRIPVFGKQLGASGRRGDVTKP